jgi:hypothetical protein
VIKQPAIKYYGDTKKATALKGVALQFYQSVCSQLGASTSLTREKRFNYIGQSVVIKASIFLNGYRDINGKVDIFVQPVISEENAILFCTSFNDGDLGTQVYKNPFKPRTELGLVDALDNPSFLMLPEPEYRSRNNYWVNNKENEAISWSYLKITPTYLNIYYGRISISGVENNNSWGEFLQPLCCSLIDDKNLLVVYINNNTGYDNNKVFIEKIGYEIDVNNHVLLFTVLSNFEFDYEIRDMTRYAWDKPVFYGLSGDSKKLYFLNYFNPRPTSPYAGILASRINYAEISEDFLYIVQDVAIYDSIPGYPDYYTTTVIDGGYTISLTTKTESIASIIDVRGKYITFAIRELSKDEEIHNIGLHEGYEYESSLIKETIDNFYLITWDGYVLTRSFFGNANTNINTVNTYTDDGIITVSSDIQSGIDQIYVYLKKIKDVIYSTYSSSSSYDLIRYYSGGVHYNSSSYSFDTSLKSKKGGIIHNNNLSNYYLFDYSYTKNVFIGSFNYYSALYVSCIFDYKKKAHKIFDYLKSLLSVTKLPQETP